MIEKFKEITEEMVELYERKNSDYGDSVHDTYVKYGPVSFLVRMEDKLNRARTLVQKGNQKVNDEKVRDTLIDLANYSILLITEMERECMSMTGTMESEDDIEFKSFIAPMDGLAYRPLLDDEWDLGK